MSNNIRDKQTPVLVRENIRLMSEAKLNRYRSALEKLMEIQDDRGYGYMASVHSGALPGRPFGPKFSLCEHGGKDHFITWHRAYLYEFEQRLQDIDPEVTVPYWDWTSQCSIENGIPAAFTDETYQDSKPNPLHHFKDLFLKPTSEPADPTDWSVFPDTFRDPDPSVLPHLASNVKEALGMSDFINFSRTLENPHNGLHTVAVNGTMKSLHSSYDPIFWSHHANVDRQFWQWQKLYGNSLIPEEQLNFVCRPFGHTVKDFLDIRALGYTYAESAHVIARSEGQLVSPVSDGAAPSHTMHFNLATLNHLPAKAKLHIYGLHHTVGSYEIRLYANNPSADARSGRDRSQGYLGSRYLFGHGECIGGSGHCSIPRTARRAFDRRPSHHLTPYNTFVNISRGVQALKSGVGRGNKVSLTVVVVDNDGKQVDPSTAINFDAIAIVCD